MLRSLYIHIHMYIYIYYLCVQANTVAETTDHPKTGIFDQVRSHLTCLFCAYSQCSEQLFKCHVLSPKNILFRQRPKVTSLTYE